MVGLSVAQAVAVVTAVIQARRTAVRAMIRGGATGVRIRRTPRLAVRIERLAPEALSFGPCSDVRCRMYRASALPAARAIWESRG